MAILRQCKFYRNLDKLSTDRRLGYCDLECDHSTCKGDIDFCERSSSLRTYFFEQVKREGGLSWEIPRRSVHFSENHKV